MACSRGRVVMADENTPIGSGTSSRRAGTRALPGLGAATADCDPRRTVFSQKINLKK